MSISCYALQSGREREVPEGTPGFLFFRPFFVERQRKSTLAFSERAQLGEPVEEVVGNLASLSAKKEVAQGVLSIKQVLPTAKSIS